jgi:hypothetical protein
MPTQLDHLVIAARDLEQGVAYLEQQLGITIPPGGEHPRMGTHNRLMRLGDSMFLEVIAVSPTLPPPEQPRWFGLDDPLVRASINLQPTLLTWVVNCDDIENLLQQAALPFGRLEEVSRGELNWYFGIPEDGRLLAGGMLPYLMQWQVESHPAQKMAELGCRLHRLHIHHPYPLWLISILESIDAGDLVQIHPLFTNHVPFLAAEIDTPAGRRVLRSPGAMLPAQ